ncbi:MFS transporter [Clostridium aestuarii]|uniref:MFS transporter n=1 Tax=Clostridium aestuarii TaxID=338193 RepID=A0ABT4CWD7_9CLOT|nr:MFS transporter [Clostridium aestuarii]MCY6483303.1 MFS transporter [Clostridium aestuarii]
MTKKEKSWIIYDWANSAYAVAIMTAVLPIFFKDVVAKEIQDSYSTAYWGYVNTFIALIVSIGAPFLGTLADYKDNKKRFMIAFVGIGAVSTCALATIQEGNIIQCLFIYSIATICFSSANIFYDAFLVDVTNKDRMDWVSSNGFAWGYIGSTIPFIISIAIILKPSLIGVSSKITTIKISFIITGLWWFLFSIPLFKNVEQIHFIEKSSHVINDSFGRMVKILSEIKKNKNIYIFLIAYFFYIDGVSTIFKMAAVYGKDVGVDSNHLLLILLVTQFVAFPFALLFGKLADKFCAKKMLMIGIGMYMFISIYGFFIKSVFDYWVLAMLVATCQGGMQALSRSMYCKMIPKEKSAGYFGIYNIIGKFSAIIGPLMIGVISHITKESKYGILSLVFLFIIGYILLNKVQEYKIV